MAGTQGGSIYLSCTLKRNCLQKRGELGPGPGVRRPAIILWRKPGRPVMLSGNQPDKPPGGGIPSRVESGAATRSGMGQA